jgi:hypothetical protein
MSGDPGGEALALLSDEELREALTREDAAVARAHAARYAIIREIDRRPGFVPGGRAGAEAVTYLRMVRADNPDEDVRIARALGDLPQLNHALATGDAGRAHVKIVERAVRAIRRADAAALDGGVMEQVDTRLTAAARDLAPREFAPVARRLVELLDPKGDGDSFDPSALDRRELVVWNDPSGLVGVTGLLPPDAGAYVRAALDRWGKPNPVSAEDGLPPIRDTRSKRQRQADALGLAMRLALGLATPATEVDRPHVVIHARRTSPVADCDQTGALSGAWFGRFLCDATVEQLTLGRNGEVLQLGRTARTATASQRRALIGRDRTCVIPNCTTPAAWADAHHVQWWSKSGKTDVSNLAMLCGPHHSAVHAGTWALEMRDGVPWSQPPIWLDREQHWRRNTYQEHVESMEQLATTPEPPDTG